MKTNYIKNLLYLFLLFALLPAGSTYAQLGKCKGKYLGNIIQNSVRSDYTAYWNQATSENGSKWGSVEGTQGKYNFATSDVAYNWAKNNNGLFKYHTLVWGSQTPGWVAGASTATLTASIQNYIKAVADHYGPMGGLKIIDVLNEPVNTAMPGNMKAALTAGYQAEPANANDKNNQYGWVIWCFQLARKQFPDAQLLINEYNVEMNWNNCRAPYIAMVNAVKNAPNLTDGKKNLIDGVGLQCHGVDNLTAANFKACIDEIWTKTGVPIHITEFDQAANPNEAKQQSVYSTLIPVAWEHPHVAGITFWGYVQGTTWINGNGAMGPNGTDSGILYSPNYATKPNGERPAMTWLKQYMTSRPSLSCCPAPAPFGSCTATNTPPAVAISSPANNATFIAPASITINATASDADGTVSNVQFFNGTTLLGSDATSPYSFVWSNVAAGTYTLTAIATDNANATTTSAAVTVTVNAPNTPPTVSIASPANNATFTAPANITINANAADANGTVSNVQFFNGTTLLGSDATSPYSFVWSNVAAGTYTLTAIATDNANATTTSAAVTVTVTNPAGQTPYNGAPANIPGTIQAEAYDLGGPGVAFNELSAGNSGNATFRGDAVDIETTTDVGGGYNIGWVTNGEWLEYTVNVTAAGAYHMDLRVAVNGDGRTLQIQMDGVNISGTVTLPNTAGWQTWQTVRVSNINLTAGQKVMRVLMTSDYLNINHIAFSPVITNSPPAVSITSPANNASFNAPASITINANATDTDGAISNVQFFNGTILLGSDNASPYSFTWTNVAAGTYSITAKATDNNGGLTTSSAVNLTVNTVASSTTIQCETACTVDGTLNETINTGFRGTGYVNTDNFTGASASWSVNSPTAQTISLGIRYAHTTAAGRPMSLSINGVTQVASIAFA
ncbi:MAG: endo-1,4-beta-xylanase, partial [Cytophagaceae bacterium]|nr:endo-1,4-beta-xylanase [Cytophagaceae bacterium]